MRDVSVFALAFSFVLLAVPSGCRKRGANPEASPAAAANSSATGNPLMDQAVAKNDPQAVLQAFNQLIEARFMTATTPLTSLDQLVKEGTLKRLPEGPAGRRYEFDSAKRQAVLR